MCTAARDRSQQLNFADFSPAIPHIEDHIPLGDLLPFVNPSRDATTEGALATELLSQQSGGPLRRLLRRDQASVRNEVRAIRTP